MWEAILIVVGAVATASFILFTGMGILFGLEDRGWISLDGEFIDRYVDWVERKVSGL